MITNCIWDNLALGISAMNWFKSWIWGKIKLNFKLWFTWKRKKKKEKRLTNPKMTSLLKS